MLVEIEIISQDRFNRSIAHVFKKSVQPCSVKRNICFYLVFFCIITGPFQILDILLPDFLVLQEVFNKFPPHQGLFRKILLSQLDRCFFSEGHGLILPDILCEFLQFFDFIQAGGSHAKGSEKPAAIDNFQYRLQGYRTVIDHAVRLRSIRELSLQEIQEAGGFSVCRITDVVLCQILFCHKDQGDFVFAESPVEIRHGIGRFCRITFPVITIRFQDALFVKYHPAVRRIHSRRTGIGDANQVIAVPVVQIAGFDAEGLHFLIPDQFFRFFQQFRGNIQAFPEVFWLEVAVIGPYSAVAQILLIAKVFLLHFLLQAVQFFQIRQNIILDPFPSF